jgi:hypothetical protein
MKSENKTENDMNDSIEKIVTESEKKNLNDITTMWIRSCPKCNVEIIYKNLRRYNRACKNLIKCQSCVQTGVVRKVKTPVTYIRNCPDCKKELIYKYKCTFANSNKNNSRCVSCSTKYRLIKRGYNNSQTRSCPQCKCTLTYKKVGHCTRSEKKRKICRKCSNELRKQSILENLKGKHNWANYNPKSCDYFDDLNIKNKWNLQHALNGGEVKILNYFVDAYDKERNIVVEYDESYHYDKQGNLKQKDVLRQQRIITHLGCKFFRYNERTKELYEIKTSTTN